MSCATASSEMRAASPRSISSFASRNRPAAAGSTQPAGSLRRAGSGADKDFPRFLAHLRLAQPHGGVAGMLAGAHVEFVAVPGADDVHGVGGVVERADGTIGGHRLDHAAEQAALANRALPV